MAAGSLATGGAAAAVGASSAAVEWALKARAIAACPDCRCDCFCVADPSGPPRLDEPDCAAGLNESAAPTDRARFEASFCVVEWNASSEALQQAVSAASQYKLELGEA